MSEKKFRSVVLVTESFPFGGTTEDAFVSPEIHPLADEFEHVYIVPVRHKGEPRHNLRLPANVHIVEDLLPVLGNKTQRLRYMLNPLVRAAVADALANHLNMRSAATFTAAAIDLRKAFAEMIARYRIDVDTTLFYTFWLEEATSALALLSRTMQREGRQLTLITRVHAHELRNRRSPLLKRFTASAVSAAYPVSGSGVDELKRLYGNTDKFSLQYLGSSRPETTGSGELPPLPPESSLNFVSISRIMPAKRVTLIAKLMRKIAQSLPHRRVTWTHVGDGPGMMELTKDLSGGLPRNLTVDLPGALRNEDVHRLLSQRPMSWGVLLSARETLPVALLECASYGIPCIATNVGDVDEMVDDETGILTSPYPDLELTAQLVADLDSAPEHYMRLRRNAYMRWSERFDAEKHRAIFARNISEGKWQG